jgi:hypothetical protein
MDQVITVVMEADNDTIRDHWGLLYDPEEAGELGQILYGQQIIDLVDSTRACGVATHE